MGQFALTLKSVSPIELAYHRLAWLLTLPTLATTHTLLSSRSLLLSKAGLRCNSTHRSCLYFLWNCPSMVTLVSSISPKHCRADSLRLNHTRESFLLKVLFSPLYVTCNPGKIQYPCFYSQKYLFTLSSTQGSRAGISLYLLKLQTWNLSVGKPFLLVSYKQNY